MALKKISIFEAESQLGELIAQAHRGETIVLTNGNDEVTLIPLPPLDLEQESPELETELLKATKAVFSPYSSAEMRAACEKVACEKRK